MKKELSLDLVFGYLFGALITYGAGSFIYLDPTWWGAASQGARTIAVVAWIVGSFFLSIFISLFRSVSS